MKRYFTIAQRRPTGYTRNGDLYVETVVRCGVCGMESRGRKRLRARL